MALTISLLEPRRAENMLAHEVHWIACQYHDTLMLTLYGFQGAG